MIPAAKNSMIPIIVYTFFLSITPAVMRRTLITAIIGGIMCENNIADGFAI